MENSRRKEKSFDFVQNSLKLLITLSTALLGFTVALMFDVSGDSGGQELFIYHPNLVKSIWILLGACVFFAILTNLKITGLLGSPNVSEGEVTIYDGAVRWLYLLSLLTFLVAIILMGVLLIRHLNSSLCD